MAVRRLLWLLIPALVLALAACGDDDQGSESASAPVQVDSPVPAVAVTLATSTPLPPTWTPAPTLTPPEARPTQAVTLDRPTATMISLPTYTPSPLPPSATPSGPVITLSTEAINDALYAAMQSAVGGYFGEVPRVSTGDGRLRVAVNLWTTPGDPATARDIVVEMSITVSGGRVVIELWRVYAVDTGQDYASDLSGDIVDEMERQVNSLLIAGAGGEGTRFSVTGVAIGPDSITFTTEIARDGQ